MKRLFLMLIAALMTFSVMAVDVPSSTQNPMVAYRLYPTQNTAFFLRLDTRNGKIDIVQWGTAPGNRFYTTLSDKSLLPSGQDMKPGRFTLYATSHPNILILLDQNNGNAWQVQWGLEPDKCALIQIDKQ